MKQAEVELTGITDILMNNPASMMEGSSAIKNTTKEINFKANADKLAYKTSSGELYVPATAIKGCLIGGASYKKFGKHAAKPMIAGGVIITPDEIKLGTKKYDLDIRTVVIQRQRVVKARPKVKNWKLKFTLIYDDSLIADGETMIKPILEEAGRRVGILDFRPAKLGNFGMFEVTKWLEK